MALPVTEGNILMRMIQLMLVSIFVFALPGLSTATLADDGAQIEVNVTFSKYLEKKLDAIDRNERKREELFRKYQDDTRIGRIRTERRFANSIYQDVAWAGAQLVPDVSDYGMRALIAGLVSEDLTRAGLAGEVGSVSVHIEKLFVASHSVAILNGTRSWTKGTVTIFDRDGKQTGAVKVSVNLITDPKVDVGYKGPDWAFPDTDERERIGPTLSYFVMRALEKIYPEHNFPKPVTIHAFF